MKKSIFIRVEIFVFIIFILSPSLQARQVVTDDVKIWARNTINKEKSLQAIPAPTNSVAVLYFKNHTETEKLTLLEKGLTLMLITDLSKVKEIQLVERVKIQALMNEIGLNTSGIASSESSVRLGKLLGVEHLIGGDILKGKTGYFTISSNLLNVQTQKTFGQPETQGKLLADLIKMEKELLFDIIRLLKIELTPELEMELNKPFTTSLKAFIYYAQAIEQLDNGNYSKANEYYEKSLEEDSNFSQAQIGILELQDLGLLTERTQPKEPEAYEEPEEDTPTVEREDRSNSNDRTSQENNLQPNGQINVGWSILFEDDEATTQSLEHITVDLAGLKDSIESSAGNSPDIEEGAYVPGALTSTEQACEFPDSWTGYEYGLQTVGKNIGSESPQLFMDDESIDRINSNSYLAYAVQLEEDRLNKEILQMHQEAVENHEVWFSINTALAHANLRERDAWFTQNADAKAGRVLKDRHGYWVRVQQYILRPDAQTVQMLNVCLRSGTGNLSGLSSINWTTTFDSNYTGNLRSLPWSNWLNTREGDGRFIQYSSSLEVPVFPETMSIQLKNTASETLKESRSFGPQMVDQQSNYVQMIESEQLTIAGHSTPYQYTESTPAKNDEYSRAPNNSDGFDYIFGNGTHNIPVAFSVLGDIDSVEEHDGSAEFKDIWDALRVNEHGAPNIGNNNLEISIDSGQHVFSRPIDVVYIPMSRMIWKSE